MPRDKLRERRVSITSKVYHKNASGTEDEYLVTFGLDAEDQVREVFCADPRIGSDIQAMLTDGCIMISIYLQTGGKPERLVKSLGENRNEGEAKGLPSSVFGAIARSILEIQQEVNAS